MPSQADTLTAALVLGITAPTDEQAARAADLAERIAAGMDEETVEQCKAEAIRQTEAQSDDD